MRRIWGSSLTSVKGVKKESLLCLFCMTVLKGAERRTIQKKKGIPPFIQTYLQALKISLTDQLLILM